VHHAGLTISPRGVLYSGVLGGTVALADGAPAAAPRGASFSPDSLLRTWSGLSEESNEGEWSPGPSGRMRG
jgi:hypothetical protein